MNPTSSNSGLGQSVHTGGYGNTGTEAEMSREAADDNATGSIVGRSERMTKEQKNLANMRVVAAQALRQASNEGESTSLEIDSSVSGAESPGGIQNRNALPDLEPQGSENSNDRTREVSALSEAYERNERAKQAILDEMNQQCGEKINSLIDLIYGDSASSGYGVNFVSHVNFLKENLVDRVSVFSEVERVLDEYNDTEIATRFKSIVSSNMK